MMQIDLNKLVHKTMELAKESSDDFEVQEAFLDVYSFPQGYGDTTGPFGGFGGQAFTTFQITVVVQEGDFGAIFAGERLYRFISFRGESRRRHQNYIHSVHTCQHLGDTIFKTLKRGGFDKDGELLKAK